MEEYEKRLVHEKLEGDRKTRELELMQKAKEQKERHMAVLVKEKEKVLKQMDKLVLSQAVKTRPQTGGGIKMNFSTLSETKSDFKENMSIMSNVSLLGPPSFLGDDTPSDIKKEVLMLKKELKKTYEQMTEKEKEIERLKKENFNLVNRCRNTLAASGMKK